MTSHCYSRSSQSLDRKAASLIKKKANREKKIQVGFPKLSQ